MADVFGGKHFAIGIKAKNRRDDHGNAGFKIYN